MAAVDPAALAESVLAGNRRAVARAITLVESMRSDRREPARELLRGIAHATGGAVRVGVSGVPGAGKSTFIDALGRRLIAAGHRVGVVAVDPSSARTGGSILGDRTRMGELAALDEAFVRPSPSGDHLGGVARATRESMLVLEAAGYDVIVVETVGVGQSEVAVAGMVDTFLLLGLARSGDQLQGIKRGILEMADVVAINKADGEHAPEARVAARDLRQALHLMRPQDTPKVLTCSALTGEGLDEVWETVTSHRQELVEAGRLEARRAEQQREWLWSMVDAELRAAARTTPTVAQHRGDWEAAVSRGDLDATEAAEKVLQALRSDWRDTP
ncbi:methylmalonyl Co-A mutase-associated GTPase MeaB [Kytococcus sedentarius]|uniref:methylmalonyl Co-A mutase-associated GTPase MeaB n=1 Tax=Kytococcus sedentarius TaxID=1276 RepID=UPI0035BBCAAA